jgi:predicted nucleic acid-binding protein
MVLVFDTSVLISAAILKGSTNDLVFRKAINEHTIVRSLATTAELEATIQKKKFDKYFSNRYEREIFAFFCLPSEVHSFV